MADFHQAGIITTVHALYRAVDRKEYLKDLEKNLEEYATHLKISLLLPSLYSEIQNPEVLDNIINEIQKVHYLSYMRSHGVPLDDAFVDMILHAYYDNALNFVKSYSDDAEANALQYDRYQEEQTVRYFRGFLWAAWEQSKGPHQSTLIPSWNRVAFSLPDIYPKLLKAVEADNKQS